MPVFAYRGLNAQGRSVQGTKDAESMNALRQSLKREGIYLTELKETSKRKQRSEQTKHWLSRIEINFDRVSTQELADTTRQLATLISSGIPLVEALDALVEQVDKQSFKNIWANVKSRVNEGISFADALNQYPKIFGGLYINMVRAGETSGALGGVLERLADFTEGQSRLQSKLFSTMMYPVIVMCIAACVTGFLFFFVVPELMPIFESQKIELPLVTSAVLFLSRFVERFWLVFLILLGIGGLVFRSWVQTKKGRARWDILLLKTPLFGPLIRMVAVARFCRTLATLTRSGVPLLKSFSIVKAVVQNTRLSDVIEDAREAVQKGENIAAPLKRSGEIPGMVVHMIAVGERTGRLEEMLSKAAESYEAQSENRIEAMTAVLEPIMIVVMGGVILVIVLSILLPMMSLMSDMAG